MSSINIERIYDPKMLKKDRIEHLEVQDFIVKLYITNQRMMDNRSKDAQEDDLLLDLKKVEEE